MMDDDEKSTTNNIDEDMVSMMFAAGLWHMEHAHWVNYAIDNYCDLFQSYDLCQIFVKIQCML